MADPACAVPALTIQLTGPLVIGYQFNWALYGVLCVQMYIYSQAGMPDSRVTKGIILWIFTLETLQTITATHDSFHELALSWGNFESLTQLYLTWLTLPVLTGVISATIQCFYAWRIYVLSTSKILTLVIVLIALMQGAAAMAEGIQLLITQNVQGTQEDTFKTTAVWLGGTAFCDILISFCMVLLLSRNRRGGFKETTTVINRIIRLVIETGMATAIFAIIELTLFLTFKHNFYHAAPSLVLSKLYSNSMMVLLNNRVSLRYGKQSTFESSQLSSAYARETLGERSAGPIQVNISRGLETYGSESIAMGPVTSHSPSERQKASLDLTGDHDLP